MFNFRRGLSPSFVERLNEEYKREGWWKAIADDRELFVAIRDDYLNVYWKGNSLLKLWKDGDALVGQVHYKYLLRPKVHPDPYIQIKGGRPQLGAPAASFFLDDLSELAALKSAADNYSGEEKTGVHSVVMSNPNIIDVEVAFGTENGRSGARVAQRIDFVALQQGKHGIVLAFYEAKTFANPGIRAKGNNVPVFKQLTGYGEFLRKAQADVKNSYMKICSNLLSLDGVSKRFSELRSTFTSISEGERELKINDEVNLVVFGYDKDQDKGGIWAAHRNKLQGELGHRLICKGSPKGLTQGISTPQR